MVFRKLQLGNFQSFSSAESLKCSQEARNSRWMFAATAAPLLLHCSLYKLPVVQEPSAVEAAPSELWEDVGSLRCSLERPMAGPIESHRPSADFWKLPVAPKTIQKLFFAI